MVDTKTHKNKNVPIVSMRRKQTLLTTLLSATILISGVGIGLGSAMAYLADSKEVTIATEEQQPTKVAMTITNGITEKCGLNREQAGKVKEIMAEHIGSLREIRFKAMNEMVAIHREISSDMRGVMNPEQFKRWEKHNEEARKRMRFRHHSRGRGSQRGGHDGRGKYGGRGGPKGSRSGGMSEMFKRLDKDNSGELTTNEIEQVPGQFQTLIQKADVNKDGKVDRKEFETQLRRRRPPSAPGRMYRPHGRPDTKPSSPPMDMSMLWAWNEGFAELFSPVPHQDN
jgi:hypothetical protein